MHARLKDINFTHRLENITKEEKTALTQKANDLKSKIANIKDIKMDGVRTAKQEIFFNLWDTSLKATFTRTTPTFQELLQNPFKEGSQDYGEYEVAKILTKMFYDNIKNALKTFKQDKEGTNLLQAYLRFSPDKERGALVKYRHERFEDIEAYDYLRLFEILIALNIKDFIKTIYEYFTLYQYDYSKLACLYVNINAELLLLYDDRIKYISMEEYFANESRIDGLYSVLIYDLIHSLQGFLKYSVKNIFDFEIVRKYKNSIEEAICGKNILYK